MYETRTLTVKNLFLYSYNRQCNTENTKILPEDLLPIDILWAKMPSTANGIQVLCLVPDTLNRTNFGDWWLVHGTLLPISRLPETKKLIGIPFYTVPCSYFGPCLLYETRKLTVYNTYSFFPNRLRKHERHTNCIRSFICYWNLASEKAIYGNWNSCFMFTAVCLNRTYSGDWCTVNSRLSPFTVNRTKMKKRVAPLSRSRSSNPSRERVWRAPLEAAAFVLCRTG